MSNHAQQYLRNVNRRPRQEPAKPQGSVLRWTSVSSKPLKAKEVR